MTKVTALPRVLGALAVAALVAALVHAQVLLPDVQEKWQADLVLSAGPDGSLMNFPNDFVENPVTDQLLVADTYNNRILRYAATTTNDRVAGAYLGVIDGMGFGGFDTPYGLAVDANGNIAVVNTGTWDAANDLIQVLSPNGSSLLYSVHLGVLTGHASKPYRITLAPNTILAPAGAATGTVYLVDGASNSVVILDATLTSVTREFFSDLASPTGLAVDAAGRIYVSDPNNYRVQVFENPLALAPGVEPMVLASLCGYGAPCTVDAPLAYPFGLAIDANGRLLVADSENNRIAVFSSFADGLQPVIASIGVPTDDRNGPTGCTPFDPGFPCLPNYVPTGPLPDSNYLADLQGPTNIQLDHTGHLLVADSSNMRVQRFVQPAMTLSASIVGGTFTTGDTITLKVVASTTDVGGLTSVTASAVPLAFSGTTCGSGSDPSLVTTSLPITTDPATAMVMPGSPVTFTMTFMASSGSGPLVFSAGASGTLVANNTPTAAQHTLDPIAINPGGTNPIPSTTVTSTPASPNGTVMTAPGNLGWFVGPDNQPTIHLEGSAGTTQIDWSIEDQATENTEPASFHSECGALKDVVISREGHTILWYRAWNADGQHQADTAPYLNGWNRITVHWSLGPLTDLVYAPPGTNNWYNAPVAVTARVSDPFAGLQHIAITAPGMAPISVSAPDSPYSSVFTVPGEGRDLTATLTATSHSGAVSVRTATFNIDTSAPVVTSNQIVLHGTSTLASANAAGWYHTAIDVAFGATDNLSGFAGADVPAGAPDNLSGLKAVPVVGNGNSLSASVTFTDLAGNAASSSVSGLMVDTVPPAFVVPPADVTAEAAGSTGATVTFATPTATDGVSGPKTVACAPASGSLFALGATLVTCTALDNADNTSTATFNVTVTPHAVADAYGVNAGGTLTVPAGGVLTNDLGFNIAAPNLLAALTAGPSHGSLTLNANGGFTYAPSTSYHGTDTFAYQATFGTLASNVATVTITIDGVNPPAAVDDTATTNEDTAVSGNVLANDTDIDTPHGSLTAVLVSGPAHGTLTLSANGAFSYLPAANWHGIDSFTYRAYDGQANSNLASGSITVNAVNDAPVASSLATTVTQGASVSGQVMATDVDNTTLSYTVGVGPAFGTLTAFNPATGAFTYQANPTAPGADSFTVIVSDGSLSSTATVSVTIRASNANPMCGAAVANPALLWPPNHKFERIGIRGVTDPDGDPITIAVTRIWQDESTMADGSGDTPIDGAIVNGVAQVRSERSGRGDGRIYQIFFTATDGKGGSCDGSVTMGVPHDQSGGPVGDSGVRYDSRVADGPVVAGTPPGGGNGADGDHDTDARKKR